MGNSHYKSNIVGKLGTETVSGFASVSASSVVATTIFAGGSTVKFKSTGIKMAARSCIVWGTATLVTNMELAATSFLGAVPYPGSMYICAATSAAAARGGGVYIRGNTAASWSQQFGA